MKRRKFLQYSSLTAAGFTLAACSNQGSTHFTQPPANFGKLEKTDLKIGIVSSLDCLPLVVAKEKGMFKKYGLDVTLVKQPTWEQVQQELHSGKLDAVQTLFAMPLWEYFGSKGGKLRSQDEENDGDKKDRDRDKKKTKSTAKDRKSTRLNSSHSTLSRMPSSA